MFPNQSPRPKTGLATERTASICNLLSKFRPPGRADRLFGRGNSGKYPYLVNGRISVLAKKELGGEISAFRGPPLRSSESLDNRLSPLACPIFPMPVTRILGSSFAVCLITRFLRVMTGADFLDQNTQVSSSLVCLFRCHRACGGWRGRGYTICLSGLIGSLSGRHLD